MQCEICGSYNAQILELFGSYYSTLCNSCRNKFTEELLQQDFYAKDYTLSITARRFLEARVQSKCAFDYTEVKSIVKEDARIRDLGFAFAKNWVQKQKEQTSGQ